MNEKMKFEHTLQVLQAPCDLSIDYDWVVQYGLEVGLSRASVKSSDFCEKRSGRYFAVTTQKSCILTKGVDSGYTIILDSVVNLGTQHASLCGAVAASILDVTLVEQHHQYRPQWLSMASYANLITAHIAFLPTQVTLVHIPNEHYPFLLHPLLRILFDEDCGENTSGTPWTQRHDFLNLSFTPFGCSLIASRALVEKWLVPMAEQFNRLLVGSSSHNLIEINHEDYVVIQVDGQGLNASERVLELTAPLAMAGISIFFITTYFSDYILVPNRSRQTVITTLQQYGFIFSPESEAFVSRLSNFAPQAGTGSRPPTGSSDSEHSRPRTATSTPSTPPAKDVPELQIRTFAKLLGNNIEPLVDSSLRLLSCAADRDLSSCDREMLRTELTKHLLATKGQAMTRHGNKIVNGSDCEPFLPVSQHDPSPAAENSPSFFSITLTEEPVSLLLEEQFLLNSRLGSHLLASKDEDDILIPIILDLRSLGWRATGIVGGVAGQLSQGPGLSTNPYDLPATPDEEEALGNVIDEPIEVNFLSSTKAGSIIVKANRMAEALGALKLGTEQARKRQLQG